MHASLPCMRVAHSVMLCACYMCHTLHRAEKKTLQSVHPATGSVGITVATAQLWCSHFFPWQKTWFWL